MGSKTKKHGHRPGVADLFHQAQRAMEKSDFKQALKDAKVCYRQDPRPEHRQLLERAWLARARALHRAGLEAESRASTQELLDFGVTVPEVRQQLPDLLVRVGLFDRYAAKLHGHNGASGAAAAPEITPELLAKAADQAVLNPARCPPRCPRSPAGRPGSARRLDALCAGDEAAATAALADVPRNSPFADWRYFVRGLAAYYRHDDEQMRANWDRLTASRQAAGIAAPLRRLAEPPSGVSQGNEPFDRAVRLLEVAVWGEKVTAYLEEMDAKWRKTIGTPSCATCGGRVLRSSGPAPR